MHTIAKIIAFKKEPAIAKVLVLKASCDRSFRNMFAIAKVLVLKASCDRKSLSFKSKLRSQIMHAIAKIITLSPSPLIKLRSPQNSTASFNPDITSITFHRNNFRVT